MAGYILRQLGGLSGGQWEQLAQVALSEPDESDAQVYLLSAAFVQAPQSQASSPMFGQIRKKLLLAANASSKGSRSEMAMALAERGTSADVPLLVSMLTNQHPLSDPASGLSPEEINQSPDNADVRAAAAYAILKIGAREK